MKLPQGLALLKIFLDTMSKDKSDNLAERFSVAHFKNPILRFSLLHANYEKKKWGGSIILKHTEKYSITQFSHVPVEITR